MSLTEEQIHSKIAHADRVLQVFEDNKSVIIPSHDNIVDMYRVSLRVWRKFKATQEECKTAQEPEMPPHVRKSFNWCGDESEAENFKWYDEEIEKLKPIDDKIERINKLLHYLRFQCYPLYQAQENLFILDVEAKKLREKLEQEKSIKRCKLGQELQIRGGGFGLKKDWFFGYDDNGNLIPFESEEEQQKAHRKTRIKKLGLRIVRFDTE